MVRQNVARVIKIGREAERRQDKPQSGIWNRPGGEVNREDILAFVDRFVSENSIRSWGQLKRQLRRKDPDLYAYMNSIECRDHYVQKFSKAQKLWRKTLVEPLQKDAKIEESESKLDTYRSILRDCLGFGKGKVPPSSKTINIRLNDHTSRMAREEAQRFEGCFDDLRSAGVIEIKKSKKGTVSVFIHTNVKLEGELKEALDSAVEEERRINPRFH